MLLDSNILIDYLRLYPPAVNFLDQAIDKHKLYVSVASHLELIKGAQNKQQLASLEIFLGKFTTRPLNQTIGGQAKHIMLKYFLTYNIGAIDSLIAATALHYKQNLVTANLKHFKVIKGLKVEKPY